MTFGNSREIDWDVLHEIGLKAKVQQLLNAGAWRQLFQITYNTYEQLELEVLFTFELSHGTIAFHRAYYIQFHIFRALHRMSLTEFSIHLGFYEAEFIRTPPYDALPSS